MAITPGIRGHLSPPSSPATATAGTVPGRPGLPPWPLTHNAVGAFPNAVQLLKLLHAPAPSQLKERGAGGEGIRQLMAPEMDMDTQLVPKSQLVSCSPNRKVTTHLGLQVRKWGDDAGLFECDIKDGLTTPFQFHGPDVCCPKGGTASHIWLKLTKMKVEVHFFSCISHVKRSMAPRSCGDHPGRFRKQNISTITESPLNSTALNYALGFSPAVHWIELRTLSAEGLDSIPDRGN